MCSSDLIGDVVGLDVADRAQQHEGDRIPLLLLILLITFKQYGEVPTNFYEFFNKAYSALLTLHDQLKHGFTRRMICGLDPEEYGAYLSAFCFQAYSGSTLDFSKKRFCDYMDVVLEDNPVRTGAKSECFLYDAVKGLSLMCREGSDSYHFIHRSFLEYLAAKHLSDNIAGSYDDLYEYFEIEKHGWRGDSVFEMLYSMNPENLDLYLFYPMLSRFLDKYGTDDRGYWLFLSKMYPKLSVLKLCSEELEDQGSEDLIDWAANLRPITSSSSFLYNFFSKQKGFSKIAELNSYAWDELDIAQCDGNFIIDDGEYLAGPVSYCGLYRHVPNSQFSDGYDSFTSIIRGYEFPLIPRLIDDEPGSRYANLYYEMNDEDFPLRQEFTAVCNWVESTRQRLEHKGNSIGTTRRLGKIAS